MTPVSPAATTPLFTPTSREAWDAAKALEASFLSEMLKSAGVGAPRDSFGGGAGEAPFASFLTAEYAASMTERGGIGLAETIYRALTSDRTST